MKVKIIERSHELDLQDDVNCFLENGYDIVSFHYDVALTSHNDQLEYTFSCFIVYNESN